MSKFVLELDEKEAYIINQALHMMVHFFQAGMVVVHAQQSITAEDVQAVIDKHVHK